jgi:hypothetical protein
MEMFVGVGPARVRDLFAQVGGAGARSKQGAARVAAAGRGCGEPGPAGSCPRLMLTPAPAPALSLPPFPQARSQAPSMIFIDEIDAIGRAR